jgi:hypothetical protein
MAQYYLSDYLQGVRSNPVLDVQIDGVYRSAASSLPGRGELRSLAETFSLDFAALYFAARVVDLPANRQFQIFYDRIRAATSARLAAGEPPLPVSAAQYRVLFVPGFLYRRHTFTGADFAVPRETLARAGMPFVFVATDEDGPVERNAALVRAAIDAQAASGRKLIVASASKSGVEVALALSQLGDGGSGHVAAWLNIVGMLQGSPLADQNIWQGLEYLTGKIDTAGIASLTTARSRRRFAGLRIPAHILVVNYIGIPVAGSISSLARRGYDRLRPYGPSDGLSLLPDLMAPAGLTLVELGSDHFLLAERMDLKTIALTTAVIRWIESRMPVPVSADRVGRRDPD